MDVVYARFSYRNSLLLSVIILFAGGCYVVIPLFSNMTLLQYIESDVWNWFWPLAALAWLCLIAMLFPLILSLTFFKGVALYRSGDMLVYMFMFRYRVVNIVRVEFVIAPGLFRNSGRINLYMDGEKTKTIRTDLFGGSPNIIADEISTNLRLAK